MSFVPVPELLEEIRAGRMVVILDDENRENEGDLIMAASHVQAADINFMARHARGLICLAMLPARANRLGLRPMVSDNKTVYGTAFTVSIEAAEGVTTGISAFDRARTIQAAVAANAKADDLRQPGHIFPLVAQPGGVLTRAGHTEASCDLAALAGLEPAGVLVEIMHDDGSMARRPDLERFASTHNLKMGTIEALIRYRLETEKTIELVHRAPVQTEFGPFELSVYRDLLSGALHSALRFGDTAEQDSTLVRVQLRNNWSDALGIDTPAHGPTLRAALRRIAHEGSGVVVALGAQLSAAAELEQLLNADQAAGAVQAPAWRTNGPGAQILQDLGVQKIRLLGTPRRYLGLSGFGLEIVDNLPFA